MNIKYLEEMKRKGNAVCSGLICSQSWKLMFLFLGITTTMDISAQTLKEQATAEIDTLGNLVTQAENKGIDALKEKMTIRTAEEFLKYADWDEGHVATNTNYFNLVPIYKDTAAQAATDLPDIERNEIISMLNESKTYLRRLIKGEIFRKPTPNVDWSKVTLDGDQLTFNGKPVFIADYTWKPAIPELTEFYGNQDGVYIDQNKVIDANGDINTSLLNDIQSKPDGTIGFIFLGNKTVPQWSEDKYGPGFRMSENTFTGYDIDNPGAKEINSMLFKGTIPLMAGKKYTQLGYMLCNEPHFYTTKTGSSIDWASGPVSNYTIEKFKVWLKNKHSSIAELNALWGTNFASFDDVTIDIPIDNSLQGTPKWYDWLAFNQARVTQWYSDMKDSILRYDPAAKVQLKVIPHLWSDDKRGHGINLEALTRLSGIIGNDAGSANSHMWGPKQYWEDDYAFDWRQLCMSYDFMKSVSPDKIMFNSECHFLSTTHFRDLFLDPAYARATYWLATTLGMDASQTWYWDRLPDGSIKSSNDKGYAGSNNQQPRIINEVTSTMMDLNTFSDDIMAMQRLKKPIRIFYSETSAIDKPTHMDDVFEIYESMNFEGVPIGFAIKDIIKDQDDKKWDVILVYKTQFVTQPELDALQTYLDNGGTVIVDAVSLKKDEYGRPLPALTQSNGTLINLSSLSDIKSKALDIVNSKGDMPGITIEETNGVGKKTCMWKCIKAADGNNVLSIVNLGKTTSKLKITLKGATKGTSCRDLITGTNVSNTPNLKPDQVFFVEVADSMATGTSDAVPQKENLWKLYPNPSSGTFQIDLSQNFSKVRLEIFTMSGTPIFSKSYSSVDQVSHCLNGCPDGTYVVSLHADSKTQNFLFVKQS